MSLVATCLRIPIASLWLASLALSASAIAAEPSGEAVKVDPHVTAADAGGVR